MNFVHFMGSSIFQIISLISVLGYLFGVLNIHFSDKNDYCEMTYMFEYPQFVRIALDENKVYPQYGLYAYSEGRLTEKTRKMWFDGVPVLFLPGNSGSYMQARSLASVALRKALEHEYDYHFDYFTISFNEELSGLYGGVLQSQTRFTVACISKILSLYKSNKYTKSVPTSVILVGHSMGGIIAKRLLAYPDTINMTSIAITLASPLQAPIINFDIDMNDYYKLMDMEWDVFINNNEEVNRRKMLLSFGNGPRDILVPSSLTSSNESYIGGLTTAIPGVWVSPDHVSIVWCKQLIVVINRFLFSIIDPRTEQSIENKQIWMNKAKQYFQANRSMILNSNINRANVSMFVDAFWYEDNRRIYQISRPDIDKTTYLMIRLVKFPQNRFVAIESVNVDDKDWIFGCNAMFTYNTYRYCKQATSMTELSRWTGAAATFGKRKLATVHLHNVMEQHPDWSHVIVKVSPTRKPITLNVDINDHASRQINVNLPSALSFGKSIIKEETEANALYYELLLPEFNKAHQAYLLYVEPTANCRATQYHVSAEVHVPWAKNHEYYHYFTQKKRSPMKLRLYMTNPNITLGLDTLEHVKVTLLLDPQCTYTISISSSWYHRLAQFVRNYTPTLVPYCAAILLLAARSNILQLKEHGTCSSIHTALMSEGVKPYYALVFGRLGTTLLMSIPFLTFIFENASWKNLELRYFIHSLLVLPAYMISLGILNIAATIILAVMVFSSQLAHRLLFRIVWRGGSGLAEKVASGLQKVPMFVSSALVCSAPLSCGAASLVAGAAFYSFMLSKMYEEYLEDYVYKLMAKVASRICRLFKSKQNIKNDESETSLVPKTNLTTDESNLDMNKQSKTDENIEVENDQKELVPLDNDVQSNKDIDEHNNRKALMEVLESPENIQLVQSEETNTDCGELNKKKNRDEGDGIDEELNNLNFHMMMFFLWLLVTVVNVPALLTWARNFKYSMVLKPDTSYHTGLVMSVCSVFTWQMDGPRRNLKYYEAVSAFIFTMAVLILALGPLSMPIVNYGVTFIFVIITIQQLCDKEVNNDLESSSSLKNDKENPNTSDSQEERDNISNEQKTASEKDEKQSNECPEFGESSGNANENCDVCNENRIYSIFKNLRDKFSYSEEL